MTRTIWDFQKLYNTKNYHLQNDYYMLGTVMHITYFTSFVPYSNTLGGYHLVLSPLVEKNLGDRKIDGVVSN